MSITVNTRTYTRDWSGVKDMLPMVGPAHTITAIDNLDFTRVAPKPTSKFSGVARAKTKLSKTVALTGALTTTGVAIFDGSFSLPVGMSSADVDVLAADIASLFTVTAVKDLLKKLEFTGF